MEQKDPNRAIETGEERSRKFSAFETFGELRHGTMEESILYEDMLERISEEIGDSRIDALDMQEDE